MDDNEIDKFMDELKEIWKTECPNLNFNRLVINVFETMPFIDPCAVNDDEMMERFRRHYISSKEEK